MTSIGLLIDTSYVKEGKEGNDWSWSKREILVNTWGNTNCECTKCASLEQWEVFGIGTTEYEVELRWWSLWERKWKLGVSNV